MIPLERAEVRGLSTLQITPNIRFYEIQTYVIIQFQHIISKSTAHRLMAMKEIDFESFNPNVKTKRRVKHPKFEKELLNFVLERKSDIYLEIRSWR